METEQMVTILLCIDTIAKAREVLHDTLETLEKYHMDDMPEKGKNDLYAIQDFCDDIKKEVTSTEDYHLGSMRKTISVSEENEIENNVLQIEDILLNNSAKPFNSFSMSEVAKAAGLSTIMDDETIEDDMR